MSSGSRDNTLGDTPRLEHEDGEPEQGENDDAHDEPDEA
jgi:hypothetical protein